MNIIKGCVFYVLAFFWTVNLYAQSKPATPFKLFFEKNYIHTDKDVYMQGDTVWFKAYLVNGQTNTPISTSGNLYAELIRTDSAKIINREIICMTNGAGNGDFSLPDTIPPGYYSLRAYTNWMRNFGDNFIFEKRLSIIAIDAGNKKGDIAAPAKTESKWRAQPKSATRSNNQPVVSFYPEGGSLVEGLNSKVAVKARDASDKGLPIQGAVLNTSGDTVAHFSCDTLGMGMLSLLPLNGQKYHAVYTYRKINYTAVLPQALLGGLAMRVNGGDSLINVVISSSDTSQRQLILTGRHAGKSFFNQPFKLINAQAILRIPKKLFPEGIAAITLYDEQNKPHCERLVYIQAASSTSLSITTDKPAYQPKSKVSVKLKLKDAVGTANLSMAVVDESVVPVQQGDIESYLLLQSELKGSIIHPERYFDTSNGNRFKQLDLLLLTQGWRDFLWRRIADSVIRISYNTENSFSVAGKVRQKLANKPITNLSITLNAFKARGKKLYSAQTDSTGSFRIDGLQLYGAQTIKVTTSDSKGNHVGWITIDSLTNDPLPIGAQNAALDTIPIDRKAVDQRQAGIATARMKQNGHQLKEVKITRRKTVVLSNMSATTFGYPDQVFDIGKKDLYFESLENWLAHNIKGAIINAQPGVMFYASDGFIPQLGHQLVYPRFIVNGRDMITPVGTTLKTPRHILFF